MSTQSELNMNPYPYILYYCNSPLGQNDPIVYNQDLSNVCSLYYDGSDNIQISGWLLGGYAVPSTVTLLSYSLVDVLAFFNNFYTIPANIAANEPYMISTSNLALIRADSSMLNFVVYDTTSKSIKYWDGTAWSTTASKYLSSQGGSLNGALDLLAHDINGVKTLNQSLPSCLSIWSSVSDTVSFTANSPQVISIGSFSQSINPNTDFTFNSSTGQCKYTGSTTKYFRVSTNYSVTALSLGATLTNYISKNGSTSISGQRNISTFLLLGPLVASAYNLSDVIQLSTNDTIQLGAQFSSTSTLTYEAVSYSISQI